jgi:hypothetical protein
VEEILGSALYFSGEIEEGEDFIACKIKVTGEVGGTGLEDAGWGRGGHVFLFNQMNNYTFGELGSTEHHRSSDS